MYYAPQQDLRQDCDLSDSENDSSTDEDQAQESTTQFSFSIENDENLRRMISSNRGRRTSDRSLDSALLPYTPAMPTVAGLTDLDASFVSTRLASDLGDNKLTSHYILSKLYNYMKISEMSKYGISVFTMTFSSYVPYLKESDLIKLIASYWCNGAHFQYIMRHRGTRIRASCYPSYVPSSHDDSQQKECTLQLQITESLLDATMDSGASAEKIEAMLLQRRADQATSFELTNQQRKKNKNIPNKGAIQSSPSERDFYTRSLKFRFWNHEVLARVFIKNCWLSPGLADTAMNAFIKSIYNRAVRLSKRKGDARRSKDAIGGGDDPCQANSALGMNFLQSFFTSYFYLDDIPKMYKHQASKASHKIADCCIVREETLRRWCELVEMLASRGAQPNNRVFSQVIPVQYALRIGKNTYNIISSSYEKLNSQLLPESFGQQDIAVPNDVWDTLCSYL